MYTNYNKKRKNRKAFLLLFVLGVFAFGAFRYAKVERSVANEDIITEASSCGTTITDNSFDSTTKFFIIDDSGSISEISPEKSTPGSAVLGITGGCSTNSLYTGGSACVKSTDNGFSINGTNFMASDVTITMDSVKAPLVLFSGSSKTEVKDSNRNNTGIYKPAGEQYDTKQILVNTTPGSGHDTVEALLENSPVKKNFGTQYSISTSGTASADPQGNIVVDKYIESDVVECNNISNPNPTKSNVSSIILKDYKFDPPGASSSTEDNEIIQIDGQCSSYRDLSLLSLINPTVCSNPWNILIGTLGSLFPSFDWNKCDPEKDTGCVSSQNLVVKMNPMFEETNAYMASRNSSAMSPEAAAKYVPVYVLTSCVARITAKSGAFKEVNVKCVWDMSYLFYENAAQAFGKAPTSNDTMTDNQYIEYLKGETTRRGAETLTSM